MTNLAIHRFVHQSARRERSGRVSTAKIHDFSAPFFLDRSQKALGWGRGGDRAGTEWEWGGDGVGEGYMSDTCIYNIRSFMCIYIYEG